MTASECVSALRYALWHVTRLRGLSWADRIAVGLLKFVAIAGYHYGKWRTLGVAPPRRPDAAVSRKALEPLIHIALNGRSKSRSNNHVHNGGRPTIGVVIPVYARTQGDVVRLMEALNRLSQQTRQPDYLILVDDGSPLAIPSIISGNRLIVVRMDVNSGPAVARNAGIWAAKRLGVRLVCFTDADCQPEPSWISVMEHAQRRTPGIVCGRTLSTEPGLAVGLYHDVCGTLNGRRLADGTMLYGCTCNLSVDFGACDQDFDVSFTGAAFEDVEFCVRAVKGGVHICYEPDAVVRHRYDCTALGLFRQFQRYGMFEGHMCFKHKDYLNWLWSSEEISSLSSVGLPLKLHAAR